MASKLRTDLSWLVSRGLKSLHEGPGGLAATSIDDMMEQTGPDDPDSIGCDTNQPPDPWDSGRDYVHDHEYGRSQEDGSQVSSGGPSSASGALKKSVTYKG